jgi:hypothetical protein
LAIERSACRGWLKQIIHSPDRFVIVPVATAEGPLGRARRRANTADQKRATTASHAKPITIKRFEKERNGKLLSGDCPRRRGYTSKRRKEIMESIPK